MRKLLAFVVAVAIALLTLTSLVFAQGAPNNAVTVNPIGLLVGVLSGEYESQTSPGSTLGIRGALWQPALGPEYDVTLLGAGIGFRKYASGRAFDGFYYGAYGSFALLSGRYYDSWDGWEDVSASTLGVSGVAGFKWLSQNGFVTDLGVAVTLPILITVSAGGLTQTDVAGLLGAGLTFSVGYAW